MRNDEIETIGLRLVALLDAALVKDPVAYQIPGSAEILSILDNSSEFAVALATGGLRLSAELKLRRAGLPFTALPLASSTDAVSREDILRMAARRAAEKHAGQFTSFTLVMACGMLERPESSGGDLSGSAQANRPNGCVMPARQ
jgi:hypothetical protein